MPFAEAAYPRHALCFHFNKYLTIHLLSITKTSPCNEHPLTPHFYIAKLGFTVVYNFFLFLLQIIDYGYSLEPPHCPTINVLSKNKKNILIFYQKIIIFTVFKNCCILHGRVFVMPKFCGCTPGFSVGHGRNSKTGFLMTWLKMTYGAFLQLLFILRSSNGLIKRKYGIHVKVWLQKFPQELSTG